MNSANKIPLLLLAALSLLACEAESPAPSPSAAAPQTANVGPKSEHDGPAKAARANVAPTKASSPGTEVATATDTKAATKALQKGRVLSKAGDDKAALAAFEAAVRKDPSRGDALCEAGWAAFKLKRHAQARDFLARGIAVADAKTKPACLYNLGRVEEDAKAPALAAAHYKASLALRENDTVQARLDGLGDVGAPTCERTWSAGIAGLESMDHKSLGAAHTVSDSRALVAQLVQGEKPYVWLAVLNTEAKSMQTLGLLTEMDLETQADRFGATFEAFGDHYVEVAFGFAYKDVYDFAEFELTGFEEGCEEWSAGDTLDEPCGPVVEAMYAASKHKSHIVCDASDADAIECSQPHGGRQAAMAALSAKSECLAWDCCFGKPVE